MTRPPINIRARQWVAMALLAAVLTGCKTVADEPALPRAGDPEMSATAEPEGVKFLPSNEPLKTGLEHFKRGEYGLAERHFRDAVEKNSRDVPAWVGLAASYDRLARFDLADRAYGIAIGLAGETTEILNNEGYSYMLRGNLKAARAKFQKALKQDPDNPTVLNNIKLLNSSSKVSRL
jgi:Flp pilus assembly protein TadD